MDLRSLDLLTLKFLSKRAQYVLHRDAIVNRAPHAHAVVHDVDAFRAVNLGGKGARTEVRQHRPDAEYAVATLDEGANLLVHHLAVVHGVIGGIVLIENAFVHEHGREWQPRGVDHRGRLLAQSAARDDDAR